MDGLHYVCVYTPSEYCYMQTIYCTYHIYRKTSCMCLAMSLQSSLAAERFITHITGTWSALSVCALMYLQGLWLSEKFDTNTTGIMTLFTMKQ